MIKNRLFNAIAIFLTTGVLMANSLPKHYTKIMDNGLEVVVIPMDNNSSVITTSVYYKVGSRDETMGKSGIAHMLEHLSFKSTKNMKAGEFDKIVKSIGGDNNAATSFDYTYYYINSTSKSLDTNMRLFSDMMSNLLLSDEEFQPERAVVAEERRLRTDNPPMGYLYFRLFNIHYDYHSYHWTPIGFMDDILGWNIEDIKSFYKRFYQPNNAVLVVSGDIQPDDVFKSAKEYFGVIKNHTEIKRDKKVEPKIDGAKRAVLHKENNPLDTIAIVFPIPNFEHSDQVGLSALSDILSGGKSSRLYKTLIDDKNMVNMIYGYNMELTDDGVFFFMAVCNPDVKAEDVEAVILKELESIKNGSISQEELQKIKINTKANFIYSLENSSSVNNLFGSYLVRGNIEPLLEYEDKLDKITTEDISNIAKRYFDNNISTTIILRSSKK